MPIIFARWKQLCACVHKLWKGSIVVHNTALDSSNTYIIFPMHHIQQKHHPSH